MKLLSSLAAAATSLAFALPATALPMYFTTTLSGLTEFPPNASPAFGDAQVTLDDALLSVLVHVDFSGLAATAAAAHIHCCTPTPGTGNVPPSLVFPGFPAVTSGSYDHTFTLSSGNFGTLLTGIQQGRAYVNLHDSVFPAGEIRGFLAVPEPATWALVLGGLALAGATTKRRGA